MAIGLGIFDTPGGTLLADHAVRAEGLEITTNEHGAEKLSYEVQLGLADAFAFWDPNGTAWTRAHLSGLDLFTGRLEDRRIQDGRLALQALGPWRALSDLPYIALWSSTQVGDFRPFLVTEIATATPDRYNFETQGGLYIAPQKNGTFGTTGAAKQAFIGYLIPDQSTRNIVGCQFSAQFVAPAANWRAAMFAQNADFSTNSVPWLFAAAGAGTTNRALHVTFTGVPIISFFMDLNAADVVLGTETGANYLRITGLRFVTSTTNRVNTTLTANRNAGAGVTATVGSTSGMYAGMQLVINSSNNPSEMITVTSVTNATQFVATFLNNYVIGNAVQGFRVLADEIAKDMTSVVNATNATQLSSSTQLIESPGLDLTDEVYEDADMQQVLVDLAEKGDTAGQRWEVGAEMLGNSPLLFFRAEGSAGQTWYVDALDIDVERSLESLRNSVYATYQDTNGRALRTAASASTSNVNRYGITRRQAVTADTTNATLAQTIRGTALTDTADPSPRAGVIFTRVFDAYGAQHLLAEIAANDTIVIRNLPPSLATTIDQIRSFRIKHTSYKADDDTIEVEPDVPRPALDFFLSRLAIGVS